MTSSACQLQFPFFLAEQDGLLEEVEEELDRVLGVVVAGDGVGDHVGVTVSVHQADRGDRNLAAISYRSAGH